MDLELVLKCTGVVLGMVGAALSSPLGVKHGLGKFGQKAGVVLDKLDALDKRVEAYLRKVFRRPGKTPATQEIAVPGIASLEGFGTLQATGFAWTPGADLETRVEQLRLRMDYLTTQMDRRFEETLQTIQDHELELQKLRQLWEELLREVRDRWDENERKTARVQAHGLPVIAVGIFLSGVPKELSDIPVLGWLALVAAGVLTTLCVRESEKSGAWED